MVCRDARLDETVPGAGLGLAIVAELAGRWRGDGRLVAGPGTRVEATFPLAPTER